MRKKPPKPDAIPLERLFLDLGFERNHSLLLEERPEQTDLTLKKAIMSELRTNAVKNLRRKLKQEEASSKGGKETARGKADELNSRNDKIAEQASKLLINGKNRREIAGILSTKNALGKLSSRQINNILKKYNINKSEAQ